MSELSAVELAELRTRRWSREDARRVLALWRESGIAITAFGRRHGFREQRLSWWKKILSDPHTRRARAKRSAQFVPAVVRAPAISIAAAPVAIRVASGVVVEIASTSEVAPEWLASFVTGLTRKD